MMAVNIFGIKELSDKIKALNFDLSKKVGLKMVASAGTVVKNEAKAIALSKGLKRTGSLIKNIAIKREKNTPLNSLQYNVGVRHGNTLTRTVRAKSKFLVRNKKGRIVTKYKNDPFYWRFLEFDMKNREGTPFIAPALVNKKQQAIDAMTKVLEKELLKAKP